ncbi:unnamed protein product [Menidia menidia]|uniref:(Atlantic silverside) hypothetical protein n=1 Tax=Menidia menidia TaxID=238744 RepID=A0A8S4AN32_9TELE|nr:unnamed protein product [Menidia menidia]
MANVLRLYTGILTALALCKYCRAEWNSTESANRTVSLCRLHGNHNNCTETGQWHGHFSTCPKELSYYCVHGECRYIKEQKAPSCRCQSGYIGSRCEYVDLDWQIGERRQIIIGCVIAGLVLLMVLIVFICMCPHRRCKLIWRRGRRREKPGNGTEKLSMMDTGTSVSAETTETTNTNSV